MKTRRPLTAEQAAARDARRQKLRDLSAAISKLSDEERTQWAMRVGQTPTCAGGLLSVRNSIMLAMQMPAVSLVGGFNQWKDAGRAVRKGEKALSILIPTGTTGPEPTATAEEQAAPGGEVRFVTGAVFDITQTDPLP